MAQAAPRDNVRLVLEFQGRRQDWIQRNLGISQTRVTRLLAGTFRWLEWEAQMLSRLTGVPLALLFPDAARIRPQSGPPWGRRVTDLPRAAEPADAEEEDESV